MFLCLCYFQRKSFTDLQPEKHWTPVFYLENLFACEFGRVITVHVRNYVTCSYKKQNIFVGYELPTTGVGK